MKKQISAKCLELLEKGQVYHWCYGNDLASHLPMGLIALDKMNASVQQLQGFYDASIEKLSLRQKSTLSFEDDEWLEHLGNIQYFEAYLHLFSKQLQKQTIEYLLKKYLPAIIEGQASYAFHALIRLGYALDADSKTEVAHALAFWCSGYQVFDELSETTDLSLSDILEKVATSAQGHKFNFGNITDRMAKACQIEAFTQLRTQPHEISLDDIADLAIGAYHKTRNFTLLHVVTSAHALRLVLPFVENRDLMLRHYWHNVVVAYLTTIAVCVNAPNDKPTLSWNEVLERASQSTDDHVVKIVYSCWAEHQRTSNEIYLKTVSQLF